MEHVKRGILESGEGMAIEKLSLIRLVGEGISCADLWGDDYSRQRKQQCKGPEAGEYKQARVPGMERDGVGAEV